MSRRDQFEKELRDFVGRSHEDEESRVAAEKIQEALCRLKADPGLAVGDPDSAFTYQDPILATAAMEYQSRRQPLSARGEGAELSNINWIEWAKTGIYAFVTRTFEDEDIVELSGMVPRSAISVESEQLRLAIVGDAGYEGRPQSNVCRMIKELHQKKPFNFVIHLGDIYFAGSDGQVSKNFLAPFNQIGPPVLTLCGNHDLYCGAGPFKRLIRILRQPGRYFAIEGKYWRVLCLDTSLAAADLLRGDGKLDSTQLDWLATQLEKRDGRNNVLMSHHFIRSGWTKGSPTLKHQLGSLAEQHVMAWYWGHEHACAAYENGGHGYAGACVGNGAFLEKWQSPSSALDQPVWFAGGTCRCFEHPREGFWEHGFLELELRPNGTAEEQFHLESGNSFQRTLLPKLSVSTGAGA